MNARLGVLSVSLVLALLALSFVSIPAHAHDYHGSSASVSLRDGNVSIVVHTDLVDLLSRSNDFADRLKLGRLPASELEQAIGRTQDEITNGQWLFLNGQPMKLKIRHFPDSTEIATAATKAFIRTQLEGDKGGSHAHPTTSIIKLEAEKHQIDVSDVVVKFPESWGDLLITFTEPHTQLLQAGHEVSLKAVPAPALVSTSAHSQGPAHGSTLVEQGETIGTNRAVILFAGLSGIAFGLMLGPLWRFFQATCFAKKTGS